MTTAFTAQLRQIADKSTHELDLKARKAAYSESLIFDKDVASSQDIETIYQICLEGFRELVQLDDRFNEFEQSLFSRQSKTQDRGRMTGQENQALDGVIEQFLQLVGGRLSLRPAVKAVEWLVRRFRVHTHNVVCLLTTFLPYHETPLFRNLMAILPKKLPSEYRFLSPYIQTLTNPPHATILYAATNTPAFFNYLNSYTIASAKDGTAQGSLTVFWGSVITEALSNQINATQSGRKEVQRQKQEDLLLRVLPLINDGLSITDSPEIHLTCHTIILMLVQKEMLAENVMTSLVDTVASNSLQSDPGPALICLSVLVRSHPDVKLSKSTFKAFLAVDSLEDHVVKVSNKYSVHCLLLCLTRSVLRRMKKENFSNMAQSVQDILNTALRINDPSSTTALLEAVIDKIISLDGQDAISVALRARLVDCVKELIDSEDLGKLTRAALALTDLDLTVVENIFEVGIDQMTDVEMKDSEDVLAIEEYPSRTRDVAEILTHVPTRSVTQTSFLESYESPLFAEVFGPFQASASSHSGLSQFESLPLWTNTEDSNKLYTSFLLRVASATPTPGTCVAALYLLRRAVKRDVKLDLQFLLPYMLALLSNPSIAVRKAATEVVLEIHRALRQDSPKSALPQADLYHQGAEVEGPVFLTIAQHTKVLEEMLMSSLEEIKADATQVGFLLRTALGRDEEQHHVGQQPASKGLKKAERRALFDLITYHLVHMPLLRPKLCLVGLLDGIDKVGSQSKTVQLLPCLETWLRMDDNEAQQKAKIESLEVSDVDEVMAQIVSARDISSLWPLINGFGDSSANVRPAILHELFRRLVKVWPKTKHSAKAPAAEHLFEMAFKKPELVAQYAQEALRNVTLPCQTLEKFLQNAREGTDGFHGATPPQKRRRTSHGRASGLEKQQQITFLSVIDKLSLGLQLVDSTPPKDIVSLLPELFETLSALQILQKTGRSRLPFLFRLCLGSIHAVVSVLPSTSANLKEAGVDLSAIQVGLIAECIRPPHSSQVQNTALLVIASLARLIPTQVVHHLMPVFTFMGGNVLSKNDDMSSHIINETLDKVIPVVVAAVRAKPSGGMIEPLADLLSSFTAAYEHMPTSRSPGLFHRLVARLGSEQYLYAIIAMLSLRFTDNSTADAFCSQLLLGFDISSQCHALRDLVLLCLDVMGPMSRSTQIITGMTQDASSDTKETCVSHILHLVASFMRGSEIRKSVSRISTEDVAVTQDVRHMIDEVFATLLHIRKVTSSNIEAHVDDCIEAQLTLLPMEEFLASFSGVLSSVDGSLRPNVLLALQKRVKSKFDRDDQSSAAALVFLQNLTTFLSSADEIISTKIAAVACIDRIVVQYGRKDRELVAAIGAELSNKDVFALHEPRVKTAVLHCLASITGTLKEGIVSIIRDVLDVAFDSLAKSIEDTEDVGMHNGSASVLTNVIYHAHFVLSQEDLVRILKLSAESTNSELEDDGNASRRDLQHVVAERFDLALMVPSLSAAWSHIVENDVDAVMEAMKLLINVIERSSKASVIEASDNIATFVLRMADLRRIQLLVFTEDSYAEEEIDRIESQLNEVVMNFVYKINDNVLRPIMAQWIDWALKCPDLSVSDDSTSARSRLLRSITLFKLLSNFFSTLKSIVTSYAGLIIEPALEISRNTLQSGQEGPSNGLEGDQLALHLDNFKLLTTALNHDQDSYFASPSHFQPLSQSLTSLLSLADLTSYRPYIQTHLIPTIVALASATIDTSDPNHRDLNKLLCNPEFRQHESAQVRAAMVETQLALCQDETVGSEWCDRTAREGETMICVNEMLEDEDAEVEKLVRRWVNAVRDKVGEDVFEV